MVNYSANNSRWWLGVGKVGGEGRKGIAFSNSWYAAQLFFFFNGLDIAEHNCTQVQGVAKSRTWLSDWTEHCIWKELCPDGWAIKAQSMPVLWSYLGLFQALSKWSEILISSYWKCPCLGEGCIKAPSAWYWQCKSHKPELGYHSAHQWQWHRAQEPAVLRWLFISVPGTAAGPESPEEDVCAYWARVELPWRLWFTRILLGESYGSIYHERQTSSRFTIRFWTLSLKSIS